MIFPFQELGDVQVKQHIRPSVFWGAVGFIMSWWPSQTSNQVLHRIGGFNDSFIQQSWK